MSARSNGTTPWVRDLVRPYRGVLATAVALGVLAALASLAQPMGIGWLVDTVGRGGGLSAPIALLIGLFCVDAFVGGMQNYLVGRAGESVVRDVRHTLVGKIFRATRKEHEQRPSGDLHARVVTDTSLLKAALTQSLATMVVSALMVTGGIVIMAVLDPLLLGLTLLCLVVAAGVTFLVARKLRGAAQLNRDRVGALGSDLNRALFAMTTIKASRAEHREQQRLGTRMDEAYRTGLGVTRLNAMLAPAVSVGLQVSFAVVFAVGMSRVAAGGMSVAEFTSFVLYLFYLITPLVTVSTALGQLQQGLAAITRLDEILRLEQEAPSPDEDAVDGESSEPTRTPPGGSGTAPTGSGTLVTFANVRFGYGNGVEVLRGTTFDIPRTGLTALVGPSGAGKSTIFTLLSRFDRPEAGTITLDGTDVGALDLAELRTRIGYVQQDPAILSGTLEENIRYAAPDASPEKFDEAVRLADLDEVIAVLPDGMNTDVGQHGSKLSGGQRQRVAIARMLLAEPELLLLDEATAQLDSNSETTLRETMRGIAEHRAVVAIAHRLSTVIDADTILVIEDGAVRARGDHDQLLATDELYQQLVRGGEVDERTPWNDAPAEEREPLRLVGPEVRE
ncbi:MULTISPECIES: ABC transporter ATP-binding protein [unclassified Actinopolyspora]|uniref:ABC transporter ATP-binding protein n=1 Tax=unclassified Actinopolyspora TaxID=2639451 RepID=UPI0013F5E66F|nr:MULTISPECIES: ABC transporter ATP-binding protein [unclassified Actinopolyspora]NHD18348.1 ABC transporter ATP-binding protein [Actinopolyspora sp. BKK2]NHE76973.1 ABC transporter ATP-binding protein [Actinopolyspora sp. BKK1]